MDRKQGDVPVWFEGPDNGGVGGALEMWTAPFAVPPTTLQRRLVMKDPKSAGGLNILSVAHGGLALFVRNRNEAHLVRLSDGQGWILSADTDTDFIDPVGITDDHILLTTAQRLSPKLPVADRPDAMVRYSRSSLGPPTEPNGL